VEPYLIARVSRYCAPSPVKRDAVPESHDANTERTFANIRLCTKFVRIRIRRILWLLLDSLSANYSVFLLTARATRQIPLDSVVRLTETKETAGRLERQSHWMTYWGSLWRNTFVYPFSFFSLLFFRRTQQVVQQFYTRRYALQPKPQVSSFYVRSSSRPSSRSLSL
jgi:hypothetical protein